MLARKHHQTLKRVHSHDRLSESGTEKSEDRVSAEGWRYLGIPVVLLRRLFMIGDA